MRRVLCLILVAVLSLTTACQNKRDNYTVIISLDGNRWDYADYFDMPLFDSLATVGVKARMEPSFPSSTFPNHYRPGPGPQRPGEQQLLEPGNEPRLRHQRC